MPSARCRRPQALGGRHAERACYYEPMPAYTGIPRVLLWIESSNSYGRRNPRRHRPPRRESGPWSLYLKLRGQEEHLPPWVTRWQGEGILARTTSRAMTQRLRGLGVPMVELLGHTARSRPASTARTLPPAGWRPSTCWNAGCGTSASSPTASRGGSNATARASWRRWKCSAAAATSIGRRAPDCGLVPQWHAGMQPSATRWLRGWRSRRAFSRRPMISRPR